MRLNYREMTTRGLNGLLVLFEVLVYATSGVPEGATGLPIGPRLPDAESGVSTDWEVYNGQPSYHGDADGTSKYSHLGKNPKPAAVDGPLLVETKANLDPGALPKPGDPSIAGQRRLVEDKTPPQRLIFHHDASGRGFHKSRGEVGGETESTTAAENSGSMSREKTNLEGGGGGGGLDGERARSVDNRRGTDAEEAGSPKDGGGHHIGESGGDGEEKPSLWSKTLKVLADKKRLQAVRLPGKDTGNRVFAQPRRKDDIEASSYLNKNDL